MSPSPETKSPKPTCDLQHATLRFGAEFDSKRRLAVLTMPFNLLRMGDAKAVPALTIPTI